MRELKFRILEKANKKLYFYSLDEIFKTDFFKSHDFKEFEISQFTGLKDCNGREIYEGDIVKYISDFYEVKFIDGAFYLKHIKDNTFLLSFFENSKTAGICIVIGNIYQNKDLLK